MPFGGPADVKPARMLLNPAIILIYGTEYFLDWLAILWCAREKWALNGVPEALDATDRVNSAVPKSIGLPKNTGESPAISSSGFG
jgi:hypothetical protein